jgi:chromate transporter
MNATSTINFREALRFWFKLGFISFGGPAGQIAIMHRELVENKRWISDRRFMHALNYCMVLPGPEAQQLATYIGWLMHGTWGGIVAGGLFVLPSLFILIALTWVYMAFGSIPLVAGMLYGIKPAVTAIVLAAAWRIGSRALGNALLWAVACAAFVAIFAFNVPFPAIIAAAALIGAFAGRINPGLFAGGGGHGASGKMVEDAIIGDATPTPPHARFRASRLASVILIGLALGGGVLGALTYWSGWDSALTQMGWFFTKAALLTFGGAYAVLPYVYQGAVDHYHWLTAAQMIDGLALGETTPGPLIMVVAFAGFVGGWTDTARMVSGAFLSGPAIVLMAMAGACVATFFTFLPSFVFILAGGPLVEATHGEIRLTAPLTCITAAVVGVVVNLALFFAWKVLWPGGTNALPFAGAFEWFSAITGVAAFVALTRYKANVMWVIAACAALGAVKTMAG